jgi:hypothetical protein
MGSAMSTATTTASVFTSFTITTRVDISTVLRGEHPALGDTRRPQRQRERDRHRGDRLQDEEQRDPPLLLAQREADVIEGIEHLGKQPRDVQGDAGSRRSTR